MSLFYCKNPFFVYLSYSKPIPNKTQRSTRRQRNIKRQRRAKKYEKTKYWTSPFDSPLPPLVLPVDTLKYSHS